MSDGGKSDAAALVSEWIHGVLHGSDQCRGRDRPLTVHDGQSDSAASGRRPEHLHTSDARQSADTFLVVRLISSECLIVIRVEIAFTQTVIAFGVFSRDQDILQLSPRQTVYKIDGKQRTVKAVSDFTEVRL